jgi:hypothetical protein
MVKCGQIRSDDAGWFAVRNKQEEEPELANRRLPGVLRHGLVKSMSDAENLKGFWFP